MNGCLALDIGGTKTSAALFTTEGRIVDDYVKTIPTPANEGEEAVYQSIKKLLTHIFEHFGIRREALLGIGVGSPGPLDRTNGIIIHAPLMGWRDFPIAKRLNADFGLPVSIDNDANLGALAEQRCGAVQGLRNVLYLTVSTGCGCGIMIDGKIYHGKNDGAGEVGHLSIDPEGPECPCGGRGCFELYASGTALTAAMRTDMASGKSSLAFEAAGYRPEALSGALLHEAAEKGDAYALELYRREGYYLGIGIANLFNIFDAEALVLGGGVTKAKRFFCDTLIETAQKRCIQKLERNQIRYSELNDRVVLHGAFFLIKEQ
ncbi:MAG: ROK family protein [Spirochaetaceae bacterium]|jgi:glucokinase|nr:ROK family protein [Spirochaetaceae bacterium]